MKNKFIELFQDKEIEKLKNQLENKESIITQLNKKIEMLEELNILNYTRAEEIYITSNTNGNAKIRDLSSAIVNDIKESSKVICRPLLNLTDYINKSINKCNIIDVKIQDRRNNNGWKKNVC